MTVAINFSFAGDLLHDDDEDDTSSMHSGKYSSINYHAVSQHEDEAQPCVPNKNPKSTRFSPKEWQGSDSSLKFPKHYGMVPPECSLQASRCKKPVDSRQLMRNRSLVDLRSQLLHRTLVEELSRRHFKTVGAVENIGFQMPCSIPEKGSSSSGRKDRRTQARGRS